jgi:salicylate hydroxylase
MVRVCKAAFEEHRMGIRVGIAGGGIGGLTAALSLLRRGFDVHVYEQAPVLGEVGPGCRSA